MRDALFRLRRHMQNEDNDDGDSESDGSDSGLTQASFNAVQWAFAYNGRLDVARAMYRIARARADDIAAANGRHRCLGEELEEREELEALAEREMIVIARNVVPDAATYHTLIQAYAYRGDLRACLETLSDMLSAPASSLSDHHHHHHHHHHDERQAKEKEGEGKDEGQRRRFTASLAAFRAIFLGFARHGVVAASNNPPPTTTTTTTTHTIHEDPQWTLPTLEALFARFLDLPHDTPLREPTLFWLVSAFSRTSGHQDSDADSSLLLRSVFERVEARFGSSALRLTQGGGESRRGRLARIRERVFSGSSL